VRLFVYLAERHDLSHSFFRNIFLTLGRRVPWNPVVRFDYKSRVHTVSYSFHPIGGFYKATTKTSSFFVVPAATELNFVVSGMLPLNNLILTKQNLGLPQLVSYNYSILCNHPKRDPLYQMWFVKQAFDAILLLRLID